VVSESKKVSKEVSEKVSKKDRALRISEKGPRKLRLGRQELFDQLRTEYEAVISYKKVLAGMIKFEEMYQPIRKGPLFVDISGSLEATNLERADRRAQILLNRRDLIQTFDGTRGKRLVVTSRGHKIFYEDYPLAKLRKKPWDGVWTVVMYDFPEKNRVLRRRTRRRLIKLGFGCPQISILVSPLPIEDPIQQLLEGEGVADRVWVLRAERVLGMENHEVVRKAWPITYDLNWLYGELLQVLPEVEGDTELLSQWRVYFLAVNNADPYLPLELLPDDWLGVDCKKEFLKLGRTGFLGALWNRFV